MTNQHQELFSRIEDAHHHLTKTDCDGCNGAAAVIRDLEGQLEAERQTYRVQHERKREWRETAQRIAAERDALQKQYQAAREALLTVAKDAHGPGYPDEHSFNGGPVKMHPHTLMMVDEALGSNPASERS